MKKSLCGFLALAMLATGVIGFSGIAEARGGRHHGQGYNYQALTPEQRVKADEIYAGYEKEVAPIRQQMILKRAELDALLLDAKPDPKKVESISRDLGELRGKKLNKRLALQDRMEKEGLPVYGMGHKGGKGGWHGGKHRGGDRDRGHGGMGPRGNNM